MSTWQQRGNEAAAFIDKCLGYRDEALELREKYDEALASNVVAGREIMLLREQIDSLKSDNERTGAENARLKARLHLGKMAFEEAETGGEIAERLANNEPAFKTETPLGKPHQEVNENIKRSAEILEGMEREMKLPHPALGDAAQEEKPTPGWLSKFRSKPEPETAAEPMAEFPEEVRRVEA